MKTLVMTTTQSKAQSEFYNGTLNELDRPIRVVRNLVAVLDLDTDELFFKTFSNVLNICEGYKIDNRVYFYSEYTQKLAPQNGTTITKDKWIKDKSAMDTNVSPMYLPRHNYDIKATYRTEATLEGVFAGAEVKEVSFKNMTCEDRQQEAELLKKLNSDSFFNPFQESQPEKLGFIIK